MLGRGFKSIQDRNYSVSVYSEVSSQAFGDYRSLSSFHMNIACFNSRSLSRGRIECFWKRGKAGSSLLSKLISLIAFLVLAEIVSMLFVGAVPQLRRL